MGIDNLYKSPSFYSTGITNVPCLFFQLITRIIRILKYPFVKIYIWQIGLGTPTCHPYYPNDIRYFPDVAQCSAVSKCLMCHRVSKKQSVPPYSQINSELIKQSKRIWSLFPRSKPDKTNTCFIILKESIRYKTSGNFCNFIFRII